MPGTVLSALRTLSHLLLTAAPRGQFSYYLHFTESELRPKVKLPTQVHPPLNGKIWDSNPSFSKAESQAFKNLFAFFKKKKKLTFDRASRWGVWSDTTLNSMLKDSGSRSNSDLEVGAFLHHVRLSPWSFSELVSYSSSVNWIKWPHNDPWRAHWSLGHLPQKASPQICRFRNVSRWRQGTHKLLRGLLCKLRFRNYCFEYDCFLFISRKRFHSSV